MSLLYVLLIYGSGTKETLQVIKGDLYEGQQGIFFDSLSMSLLAGTCHLNWKFNWPPERQIAILERKLLRSEMSIKKLKFGQFC